MSLVRYYLPTRSVYFLTDFVQIAVDPGRLYERSICMLPHEIWAIIFEFIPAHERVPLMWSLLCRYPSFAFVFSHLPHLWMDWFFYSGCRRHQPPATSFAIALWRSLHDRGRSIPVAVHATTSAVRITALSCFLPLDSLSFVHSITIRISRNQFKTCNMHGFLGGFINLRTVGLIVRDHHQDFDGTPVPLMSVSVPRAVVVSLSNLTTLELTGILFDKTTVDPSCFRSLTTLRLFDVRARRGQNNPSVFDLLIAAPFVRDLVVRPSWVHRGTSPILYAVPEEGILGVYTRTSRLRSMELAGDRQSLAPFVNTLLACLGDRVVKLRVVFHCKRRHQLDLFDELPVFTKAISGHSGHTTVNVPEHSICSRWSGDAYSDVEWFVQWMTYDVWEDYWVCPAVWLLCCHLLNHLLLTARRNAGCVYEQIPSLCCRRVD